VVVVAVDAMGGDHAPDVVLDGAIAAVRELNVRVTLVGPEDRLRAGLAARNAPAGIDVVHAPDVIDMHDSPVTAVRQKTESSLVVGMRLVRDGAASAFVSAGSTGACMASSLFELRRIRGVDRPALGAPFPTVTGSALIIDVGANVDSKPEHLVQFGIMGSIYMERVFGIARPRVAIMNIGEEESKGNALVQATIPLLRQAPINFIGNVEGRDVPAGAAEVVVCDGFVGNVALKFGEGLASTINSLIRAEITRDWFSKLCALGLRPAFRRVRKRLDYAEYGGVPLLGVNGICIVGHGSSNAVAIKNAIRVGAQAVEQRVVETIAEGVAAASVR
jgi:glycerol-3-phosphate acyltransferase PlsX